MYKDTHHLKPQTPYQTSTTGRRLFILILFSIEFSPARGALHIGPVACTSLMTKRACPRKAAHSWVSVSGIARNGVTEPFTLYKRRRHREWGIGWPLRGIGHRRQGT